mmetsp:Transcript_8100/g.19840  ORF Transcript_8100/g.19840 Transcript_8100/m.19840 type:complete len:223 (+) Transcript_8100:4589-5257(+)
MPRLQIVEGGRCGGSHTGVPEARPARVEGQGGDGDHPHGERPQVDGQLHRQVRRKRAGDGPRPRLPRRLREGLAHVEHDREDGDRGHDHGGAREPVLRRALLRLRVRARGAAEPQHLQPQHHRQLEDHEGDERERRDVFGDHAADPQVHDLLRAPLRPPAVRREGGSMGRASGAKDDRRVRRGARGPQRLRDGPHVPHLERSHRVRTREESVRGRHRHRLID